MGINYSNRSGSRSVFRNAAVWLMSIALVLFVAFSILIIFLGNLPSQPVLPFVGSAAEWDNLEAQQTELLDTYGWVDQDAGVVHIPIERAIQLQLERGLPVSEGGEEARSGN